jgi:PAS domain S-box-containing protein
MLEFLKKLFRKRAAPASTGTATLRAAAARQSRTGTGLRESEEHFGQLVSGVRDYAVFLLDRHGHVLTWNTGAERIKGYRAEEIIGQHFSRFYPTESVSSGWPDHELSVASATGRFEDEGWRVRKDGSRFWASVVITALREDSGETRGFLKITRDLTDRKQAEEKLRLSEERFRLLVEGVQDYAIFMLDTQGRVKTWNAGAQRLKGYTADEIIGQHFSRFYPQEDVQAGKPERELEIATATGKYGEEGWRLRKDGTHFWASVVITALRDEAGVLRGFGKVTRDMTERKEAEENARRLLQEEATRKAGEARLYLAAIVESSDDAIIGKTLDGRIASWNRGAHRLYGYTAEEIVGKPLALLVPPDHADELPAIMERIMRGDFIEHYETQRIRKDGSRVEVSLTISPVRNAEGKIIGASKVARDITARKEEDRRKNEFIALLAHELRNPLAPLRNALQVMRLAGNDREAGEQARTMMERQLQHLVRLVDDLLDVSRISQGKLQLRKERISLAAIVGNALEVCEGLATQQDHELVVTLPQEPLYVDADKTRLAQALCNLLSNAVKYSDRGSPIWLTVRREANEAAISVKDAGVGIQAPMLPKVFDLFTQIDRSLEKSQGGLGVGLTIVKRLVEMHGGSVEAHSDGLGLGSEFVVRLPLVLALAQEGQDQEDNRQISRTTQHRILVVDDNVDAASSLALMLKIMGHEVRTANDGLEGVETAAAFRPDLILLDIGMPRLNGYDACRRIREQPWGKNVNIVALTGWGQDEDKRRSKEAGFDSHLVKPVEPAAVESLLAKLKTQTA